MGGCCRKLPEDPAHEPRPAKHPLDSQWEQLEVPRWDVDTTVWRGVGGDRLEPLLEQIDLVDLKFIIENTEAGRPVPRWQDVPRGARINAGNLHRIQTCIRGAVLSVLVLSYPWLDAEHPDKNLRTMRRLLPCLKAFLQIVRDNDERCTVGLMMDYPCLPQKSTSGEDDRTEEEQIRFKNGLRTINEWYAHKNTTVVVFDTEMPGEESGHGNLRPHSARGWCAFEVRASSLVKHSLCLWSLKAYEQGGSAPNWENAMNSATLAVVRPAPMVPEDFAKLLRDGVGAGTLAFTAKADLDVVTEQYGKAFEAAFRGAEKLYFAFLEWGDVEMDTLARALTIAKERGQLAHCGLVEVGHNPCGEAGLIALVEAIKGTSCAIDASDTNCTEAGKIAVKKAAEASKVEVRNI